MRPTLSLACAGCALALAACGGGGGGGDDDDRLDLTTPGVDEQRGAAARAREPRGRQGRRARRARMGGHAAARRRPRRARYFALPSVVANGTAPIKLDSRADVRFFNRTLPVRRQGDRHRDGGERLLHRDVPADGAARPRLVRHRHRRRPPATAFRVRDELITDWLRVPDVDSEPATPS